MTTKSRIVRVFLSSTFRDFAEERDLLVRKVFPELRRKCRERQVELVDVDLRWGITEEEAQQGKVLPICLAEIDRARPFFMGFIGERYGWIPEPEKYDLSLILEQPWLDEHKGGKSVTELEMLHGVLNNPAMADRAFFYFRDPKWSRKKGGAYLSEGLAEKEKLEALKDRIRRSGFPVVEDYPAPEALAERVQNDLWHLIDEAFPESEVPDALAQERMRHETFASSRRGLYIGGEKLGLYIGGEKYFQEIDAAISGEPRKPILVCGASGGGKSALLSNWAYVPAHSGAIVLTHFLATGVDAADPVSMTIRLLREISRIIGEEFIFEGDPSEALHLLEPWLEKAGAFARRKKVGFILVLDALDKMTAHQDLDWWPRELPDGVALVASCLDGGIRDVVLQKMAWREVRVSPLERLDCERFILEHLAKYRKTLIPRQTATVLGHPLCGNPLFLRTLLEELRVFGVHEELNDRLAHYLASATIDDLFEKVLARIEADNTQQAVRSALEVLWAAKESFAEDELLSVSGLPPAVWAPVHIALDESLIGAGGRLAFSHDYLRKAVEDRYLTTPEARHRVQKRMAEFCAQAMADGHKQTSRYVRRHAVEHFLEVEDWDNATATLSDLDFIEARAIAHELPEMLRDYLAAVKLLPKGEKERKTDAARQAKLDRYAKDKVEYVAAWSRIRDGSPEPKPAPPKPLPQVRMRTEEKIVAERKRITEQPGRLDIVKAFRVFTATHSRPLQQYGAQEGFVANLARNDAPAGSVHEAGEKGLQSFEGIKLIKDFHLGEIYNPLPACRAVLEGHSQGVSSLAVSVDGRRVVSGSNDDTLRIWDTETGVCLHVLNGHQGTIFSIFLTADGRRIVSGSEDGSIRIWDTETGACLRVLDEMSKQGFTGRLVLNFDERRIVSSHEHSYKGVYELRIWDMETGACLHILKGHTGSIQAFALSSDGRRVVSGGLDATVRIWDAESGVCLHILKEKISYEDQKQYITVLTLSPDGRFVVTGSRDSGDFGFYTICIWDMETGECLHVLEEHTDKIRALVVSADGRHLASGGDDKTLRIWDMRTGQCLHVLEGHEGRIDVIILSADGRRVVSASWDSTLRIWDRKTGACLRVFKGHTGTVNSIASSADGQRVVSGSNDKTLRIWDLESGICLEKPDDLIGDRSADNFLCRPEYQNRRAMSAISSDGRHGVTEETPFEVWDLESDKSLHVLNIEGLAEKSESLLKYFNPRALFSPDGQRVILAINDVKTNVDGSTKQDAAIRVFDMKTGVCRRDILGHPDWVCSMAVSFDGRRLLSGGRDGIIRIWDMETGECLRVLEGHTNHVDRIALTADGRRIVSWCLYIRPEIRIWDLETGACLHTLEGHSADIRDLTFSPDGKRIVSGSLDSTIRIWDIESGACIHVLKGHTDEIRSFKLSADGLRILSCAKDQTLRIWDVETGTCQGVFFLPGLDSMDTNPELDKLVVGFADGRKECYYII